MSAPKRITDAQLLAVLEAYSWNITAAAEHLGMARSSLYARLQDPAPGPLLDAVVRRREASQVSESSGVSGMEGVSGMSDMKRSVASRGTVVANRVAVFPTQGDALNFLGVSQASQAIRFEPAATPRVRLSEPQLKEFEAARVRLSGALGQSISAASLLGQFWRTFGPWVEQTAADIEAANEKDAAEREGGGE